ncbi:MAG: deoxyribodipyrimidine photo-lyase [Pseudomonadota bacterium]
MITALVWFRQDLRLADNPALLAAIHAAQVVVPVFIWSPEEEGDWAPGGAARWWLHESLRALDASLRERGSQLVLARGPTVETLRVLARDTGATQLYWNCRYEPAALRVEKMLSDELDAAGIIAHGFHSSRLVEPASVRGASGDPLKVFTPFWRAFLAQARIEAPEGSPAQVPAPRTWPVSLPLALLGVLPHHPWHHKLAAHWQPGEAAARTQLKTFVQRQLAEYASTRDRPDLACTSRLSPYLRHGELSPRQVWTAVVRALERSGIGAEAARSDKYLAELVWREFATQQLLLHPMLPERASSPQFDSIPWRDAPRDFNAWTRGATGEDMVDAGMRELWQSGWMHNRVRMTTASYLVKNLLLDWRRGERWYWDTLVDADLASNALNWQWVAGTSPDAAPWFRIFNPQSQAQKFDPEGTYRRRYLDGGAPARPAKPLVDLKESRVRALDAYGKAVR